MVHLNSSILVSFVFYGFVLSLSLVPLIDHRDSHLLVGIQPRTEEVLREDTISVALFRDHIISLYIATHISCLPLSHLIFLHFILHDAM